MDADEKEISNFLRSFRGQFISGREIARRAGGKWKFRQDPHWAVPILTRLVEKGVLERDSTGHFRLRPKEKNEKKKWVSPEVQKILAKSGIDFKEIIEIEDEPA